MLFSYCTHSGLSFITSFIKIGQILNELQLIHFVSYMKRAYCCLHHSFPNGGSTTTQPYLLLAKIRQRILQRFQGNHFGFDDSLIRR